MILMGSCSALQKPYGYNIAEQYASAVYGIWDLNNGFHRRLSRLMLGGRRVRGLYHRWICDHEEVTCLARFRGRRDAEIQDYLMLLLVPEGGVLTRRGRPVNCSQVRLRAMMSLSCERRRIIFDATSFEKTPTETCESTHIPFSEHDHISDGKSLQWYRKKCLEVLPDQIGYAPFRQV